MCQKCIEQEKEAAKVIAGSAGWMVMAIKGDQTEVHCKADDDDLSLFAIHSFRTLYEQNKERAIAVYMMMAREVLGFQVMKKTISQEGNA